MSTSCISPKQASATARQQTFTAVMQVQELLFDQQHQIDLLLRGTSSMRGSMDVLRRSSREIESKNRELQEELEKQHAAALK